MTPPTKDHLLSATDGGTSPGVIFAGVSRMHPNPRFYKYYWRIFTFDSPWEGPDFFARTTELSTFNAMRLISQYREERISCLVYNRKEPRLDPVAPWDLTSARWRGRRFAPAWDDDPDPVWDGYK